ncbi:MAG: hypothetical protein C0510_12295 [Erythrobacter sp.]|nr:hypothetical protein [Erythrobacter sp.]
MAPISNTLACAAAICAASLAIPAHAEVVESTTGGFVTRDAAVVKASPKEAWLALIAPRNWWSSAHTWSGDAANLTLAPKAGGCFCERIPEVADPDRITLEGSVEHMRVIQAYPERALRMEGALGPLQSEAVTGILTIAISEVEEGTRIVWEYVVGGHMRFEIPVIAKAVDGVLSQQLAGLAASLGRVDVSTVPDKGEREPEPEPEVQSEPEVPEQEASPEPSIEEAIDAMQRGKDVPPQ